VDHANGSVPARYGPPRLPLMKGPPAAAHRDYVTLKLWSEHLPLAKDECRKSEIEDYPKRNRRPGAALLRFEGDKGLPIGEAAPAGRRSLLSYGRRAPRSRTQVDPLD